MGITCIKQDRSVERSSKVVGYSKCTRVLLRPLERSAYSFATVELRDGNRERERERDKVWGVAVDAPRSSWVRSELEQEGKH